ncbi:Calmodulin-binding transcription activator protein with CG-1 and Ankyrin domains, putative isoform 1 [Theobroma cacao]|uniref:Calmodulin-binding transcription activator protein with CG-1 and Ankyrin domains, putative isoform 1 n=1 Tax=Theobroma cacao TaxID=3641 RepID=A0A061DIL9_THECC|nr:Calmodulin-binding transcription activator protein with CG-1 and Ankyrin domains, putative isoform 1 [Theobroma cacao]
MAETRRYGLSNQLDIEQILMEAQHRWLRPAEICEILKDYKKFHIAPEPAHMPPSGSLFLFDRKVLRYFRKDGHNWRKKKDGKTVKEAHERLKAGSIDVLHCYYAHGEDNENFQRRSYWMLEEDLSHIVLVHYREVKGNRTNFNRIKETEEAIPYSQDTEGILPNSEMESSVSSSFHPNNGQIPSKTTDTTSLNSVQASEYEDAESDYNHQASSQFNSFLELQQPVVGRVDSGFSDPYVPLSHSNDYHGKPSGTGFQLTQPDKSREYNDAGLTYEPQKNLDFTSWEDVLENCTPGVESAQHQPPFSSTQRDTMGQLFNNSFLTKQEFDNQAPVQEEWQASEGDSSHLSKWPLNQKLHPDLRYDLTFRFHEQEVNHHVHPDKQHDNSMQNNEQIEPSNGKHGYALKPDPESHLTLEGKSINSSAMRQHLFDGSLVEEGLKKLDSFNRWMSKELGDVDESHMQSSSGAYWDAVEGQNGVDVSTIPSQGQLDTFLLGPSLSQDQLFSIIDFSPNWAYVGSEIKVLITGRFLKSRDEAENCKWSCMFGEVEVPAEVIADGVLRCHTPIHKAGRVPFYVTCSNRLACSEVREFEYRVNHMETMDYPRSNTNEILDMRFGRLLCLGPRSPYSITYNVADVSQLSDEINSLLKEDIKEWDQMLMHNSAEEISPEKMKEQLLQKLLKEKLRVWLLQKVAEGGKGPNILDDGGQGVIHFAAALGYDWALEPTIVAGVSVNFRDVNGWTALHWAASYGRERTVASLISLGAAPGALTDPTPKYPLGRTPADLASTNGHKGISGYLAESDLSFHLRSLNLDNQGNNDTVDSRADAIQKILERSTAPLGCGDASDGPSLKDSLAAVRNATQAAARIHQVFRVQSFQKRQLKEYGDGKFGMSNERALSLIAVKSNKPGQHDEHVQAAAIRIQNKFRGWKGRKEFLIIRQRIVKIQAHVRGHQVRKTYRKIVWSVGILEKVILRWRRKGSGLRGFKPEALTEGPSIRAPPPKEDDYDFLKEGRKQTEERLQKALARVKSMAQNPAGRDQYSRMKNVVTEIQETKVMYDKVLSSTETVLDEDLIDLEKLLDADTFMHTHLE